VLEPWRVDQVSLVEGDHMVSYNWQGMRELCKCILTVFLEPASTSQLSGSHLQNACTKATWNSLLQQWVCVGSSCFGKLSLTWEYEW